MARTRTNLLGLSVAPGHDNERQAQTSWSISTLSLYGKHAAASYGFFAQLRPILLRRRSHARRISTIKISHGLTAETVVRSIFDFFDAVHQHLVTPLA